VFEKIDKKRREVKKMKKIIITVAFLMLAIGVNINYAAALSLDPYFGPVSIKLQNYEVVTNPAVNPDGSIAFSDGLEDNWGIFKVTSIEAGDSTIWQDNKNGEHLTGMFYGFDIAAITPLLGGKTQVDMANTNLIGKLDVYLDVNGAGYTAFNSTLGPGVRSGVNSYPTVTDSNVYGVPALSLQMVPGILPGITISNVLDSATIIGSGKGNGFAEVTGGALSPLFNNNNYLGGLADMYLSLNYKVPGSNGWTIDSDDPIRTDIVPEPASMLLFGMGVLGLATSRLRRKKVA